MARSKKAAPDAAPAVKDAPAKSVLKKVLPQKEKEKEKEEAVYLQLGSGEWNITDCKERAAAAFTAAGHRASSIKKLVVYLKPEEGRAYYVVNDKETGSIDL